MIGVAVDARAVLQALPLVLKQSQFAAAGALNDTAIEFRDTERNYLEGVMTIRRPFVLQGIQVPRGQFATRTKLSTTIEVEQRRDFLNKFEDGGTKRPRGLHIAIPDDQAFKRSSVVPKGKRPKALEFKLHRTSGGAVQFKGEQRTFIIERSTFESGIFQRFGRGRRSDVRLLFWFTRSAQIPAELRFERTAREVAAKSYAAHFNRRFVEALRTARA